MSTSLLGTYFDLHGGGMDLKFPHHENEIAQSCAACGTPFVRLWMHNGFVRINDEKMSKSLGNFFTMREVLKTLRDPEVLRFFLLSSHYRGPINYSEAQLTQADETLLGLYRALADKGRAVRIPVHMLDTYNRVARATQTIIARTGHEPSLEDLEKETGVPREKLEKVKELYGPRFYGLPANDERVTLRAAPLCAAERIDVPGGDKSVVVFRPDTPVGWSF